MLQNTVKGALGMQVVVLHKHCTDIMTNMEAVATASPI